MVRLAGIRDGLTTHVVRANQKVLALPGYAAGMVEGSYAAPPWWVVAGKTCVAAYQPKGAASYAASKVNLANPGTYDATDGVAPSWAAETGWTFDGVDAYLKSGVVHPGVVRTWSLAVAVTFSNSTATIAGIGNTYTDNGYFRIYANLSGSSYYGQGGQSPGATKATPYTGVLAVSGSLGYKDGSPDGAVIPDSGVIGNLEIFIGALNHAVIGVREYFDGDIRALALYSDTLTADEVATLSAAMAAL